MGPVCETDSESAMLSNYDQSQQGPDVCHEKALGDVVDDERKIDYGEVWRVRDRCQDDVGDTHESEADCHSMSAFACLVCDPPYHWCSQDLDK